jgi:hypothetical protein
MTDEISEIDTEAEPNPAAAPTYTAPKLTVYGTLMQLTLSGGQSGNEGAGPFPLHKVST